MSQDKRDKNRDKPREKPTSSDADTAASSAPETKTNDPTTKQAADDKSGRASRPAASGPSDQAQSGQAASGPGGHDGSNDDGQRGADRSGDKSGRTSGQTPEQTSGSPVVGESSGAASGSPRAASSGGSNQKGPSSSGAKEKRADPSTSRSDKPGGSASAGSSAASKASSASGSSPARTASKDRQQGSSAAGGGGAATGQRATGSTSGGRRSGLVIAVVALIIALIAAAGAGVLWYRGQQRLAALGSRVDTVEQGLQKNVQKVVMPKLADMRDSLQQQAQRIDDLSGTLDQRKQQIAQLKQTLQHVQSRNSQLSDQLGGNHERFVEQRIALLLEAANQRLQVAHDPEGARQALQLADQAIQKAGDPQLHPVRAKIADEMAALKALPNPDIEGLSLRLAKAIDQIPKLPLASNVPSSYQSQKSSGSNSDSNDQQQGSDQKGGGFAGIRLAGKWHQFVDSVGGALRQMVTIRHANGTENAPALMAPDQSFFLVQNLQLQLRIARLALLDGDAQTYHDALGEARDWIKRYFDTGNSQVASVLDELGQLSHVKLDWQAPDLSASLNTLRRIMARNSQAGGDEAAETNGGNDTGRAKAPAGQSNDSGQDPTHDDANAAGSS